ncbi:Formate/nitrite transporter [Flagelloscypha sp. PMI_526]|nr:Formate/nitrite transporter [Flagelloscypha sp. PMI_526]
MPSATLKPAEVAASFVQAAVAKHRDRYDAVLIKAFAAGVMLSMGGLLSVIVGGGSATLTQENPGIAKALSGFVFPCGLVMIVLQGLELLTSNMMSFPMAIMKRQVPWWSLPLNWFIVFWGNLAGSLFFGALLVKYSGILSAAPYPAYIQALAVKKAVDPQWHQIFLRGIGCNWLVCVAVWQAAGAKDTVSKIFGIWIPIWLFVAAGFDHIVANMFSLPLGIMFGSALTTSEYISKSLFASFFGNIVGALFVGVPAAYYLLPDYGAGGLEAAEAGGASNSADSSPTPEKAHTSSDDFTNTKNK